MAVNDGYPSPLGPTANPKDAERLRFIQELTANAGEVQEKVLAEILTMNRQTEYLERFGLDGAVDRETFKSKVPVITYDEIKPDIQRIANGDRSPILSGRPIYEFLTSSGTSAGEKKLMPSIREEWDRRHTMYSLLSAVMNINVPDLDKGKALYFYFVKSETKTPGGLPTRPVLTSYYKSDHFLSRPHDPYQVLTSPNAAILCPDAFQSMYVQMLCGLHYREDVLRLGAVFASGLLRAIRFLQLHYQELAHDLSTGTLSPRITDPAVRASVAHLPPNPLAGELVERECSTGNWEGIVSRIWPKTKYLDVIVTGAMAQYIPTLDFYTGGLPLVCTMYGSSECYFGLNLHPLCKPSEVSYAIMPNMAYFEFMPLSEPAGRLVDLADVEVGKEYELVVTTYSGLYRYRVGDVLRVTGFHNAAPQFKFVRRKNVLLSIETDKTDESELQKGVDSALRLLDDYATSVVEYTSRVETKTIPGHYVVYFELLSKDPSRKPSEEVLERCSLAIEEELNAGYRQGRAESGSIGALEIKVVREGTFEELMDYAISRGASINQYKVPRCVNFTPIVELLDSRVVSSHFSCGLPRWSHPRR